MATKVAVTVVAGEMPTVAWAHGAAPTLTGQEPLWTGPSIGLGGAVVAADRLRVTLAAAFPVEDIRAPIELQAARRVRGMVVVDLRFQS
ncbi:hypothetical protein [Streptomyces tendae]|uniref:hypothetical protein n=1 Tax=Streptomyces tendae TaxID=1932 RepID=UPI0019125386|nr:hypothetical protein [Streptomyces tendae]